MRKLILAVILISILGGCGPKQQAAPSPQQQAQYHAASPTQPGAPMDREALRTHLTTIAKRVPGVQNVNCVVFGNTAIVGIDVDANLDRSRVGTIKYSVAEALSKDKYGAQSVVTADVDMNQRLREIGNDIRNGYPIHGFSNELADIVGRIVPQMPKSVKQMKQTVEQRSPALNK
ncbi:YhcN/YlaJ family sporulation lipoprotein [Paenibacillus sp. SC116]|uniref:YhcN/YlaJ family sporulation lipoprotein n=1 Tax=Paenibacillus sp. SC116 TaxID=2968986 RepID=UPI00215B5107|nr:YhcN/YlaJ family sporulation lipoprotein [Paenibacillus sp. SC116]MCR8845767.1 YhcN/YlaJ family sporulation lipoprotein [Paenibacillus sp. SC116]